MTESLRATENLKRMCEELQQAKRESKGDQIASLTIQSNQADSLVGPMLITGDQHDTAPHFTQTGRALSQTLESYDGQILSQPTPHTLRQTLSDDNNDLIA